MTLFTISFRQAETWKLVIIGHQLEDLIRQQLQAIRSRFHLWHQVMRFHEL
jgi:hypothetical protein